MHLFMQSRTMLQPIIFSSNLQYFLFGQSIKAIFFHMGIGEQNIFGMKVFKICTKLTLNYRIQFYICAGRTYSAALVWSSCLRTTASWSPTPAPAPSSAVASRRAPASAWSVLKLTSGRIGSQYVRAVFSIVMALLDKPRGSEMLKTFVLKYCCQRGSDKDIPDICQFRDTTALFSPVNVHQKVC